MVFIQCHSSETATSLVHGGVQSWFGNCTCFFYIIMLWLIFLVLGIIFQAFQVIPRFQHLTHIKQVRTFHCSQSHSYDWYSRFPEDDSCRFCWPLCPPPSSCQSSWKAFDAWMFENEPLYFKFKVHLVNILQNRIA